MRVVTGPLPEKVGYVQDPLILIIASGNKVKRPVVITSPVDDYEVCVSYCLRVRGVTLIFMSICVGIRNDAGHRSVTSS